MKNNYRILADILLVNMIFSLQCEKAYCAPPDVSIDESVYVNLDYYGNKSDISIVKGCNLNGNSEFVDYGNYQKVMNMSNYSQPDLEDDSVTWKIDDNDIGKRFYYECIPKDDNVVLPWTFDIGYKLNGVPIEADKLAGAAGEVEITIKATPNEDAQEYYKNNMILQVGTYIDMDKTLSIEAEGAQTQSLGTYKMITFIGLPGEENTFTIRIGTDKFETYGIEMMMIPGTLDQLKKVKELKESKDTLQDSMDSIYDNLNDVLGIFGNMKDGLETLKNGSNKLDSTREYINDSKGEVYDKSDKSKDDLKDLSSKIENIVPNLQNLEKIIQEIDESSNDMTSSANDFKTDFEKLKNSVKNLQTSMDKYQQLLKKSKNLEDDTEDFIDDLQSEIDDFSGNLSRFKSDFNKIKDFIEKLKDKINSVKDVIAKINNIKTFKILTTLDEKCDDILKKLENIEKSNKNIQDTIENGSDLLDSLSDGADIGEDYYDILEDANGDTKKVLKQTDRIGERVQKSIDSINNFITDVEGINDTFNNYYLDTIGMVKKCEDIVDTSNQGISDLCESFDSTEDLLKGTGEKLNPSTEETLDGLISLLEDGMDASNTTKSIKDTNKIIKDTIDNEVDKYEKDTNVLNMDSDAKLLSFTSEKNPTPQSIQIIVRTQEINLDSIEDDSDLEKQDENIGLVNRIKNIFSKILEIFK